MLGAAFDSNGARVLTWSDDGTAQVWEASSGKALSDPMKHVQSMRGAAYDRDGARVLPWGRDGAARVWGPTLPQTFPRDLLPIWYEVWTGTRVTEVGDLEVLDGQPCQRLKEDSTRPLSN